MIPLGPVVARTRISAPRSAVWAFLAEADRRAAWWSEVQLDLRNGGSIVERWEGTEQEAGRDVSGEVDVLVEGHAIGFRWRDVGDERDTSVLVTLRAQGADTGVTVTESGFDALPAAAERAAAAHEDWQELLAAYTEAVEAAVAEGFVAEASPSVTAAPVPSVEQAEQIAAEEVVEIATADALPGALAPGSAGSDTIPVVLGEDAEGKVEESDAQVPESAEPVEVVADRASEVELEPVEQDVTETELVNDASAEFEGADEAVVSVSTEAADDANDVDSGAEQDEAAAETEWAETTEGVVPLVLPGPPAGDTPASPADGVDAAVSPDSDNAARDQEELFESTGDPDFDALLRGDDTV